MGAPTEPWASDAITTEELAAREAVGDDAHLVAAGTSPPAGG